MAPDIIKAGDAIVHANLITTLMNIQLLFGDPKSSYWSDYVKTDLSAKRYLENEHGRVHPRVLEKCNMALTAWLKAAVSEATVSPPPILVFSPQKETCKRSP
jgi:hypothetical protein